MKRKEPLPELLSPAGSESAFFAAVAGGADAVYLGVREGASNARTLAENFDREQLSRLIPLAHAHGVKVYVTLNTLTYDREIPEILADKTLWGEDLSAMTDAVKSANWRQR